MDFLRIIVAILLPPFNPFAKKRPEKVPPVKIFGAGERDFGAILEFVPVKYL